MWTTVALVAVTAIICSSIVKNRRLIMSATAENARQLAQLRDQLVALAPTFQRGLSEVSTRIETLQNENTALDFGPVNEALAPLQAAAEALDAIVPDVVVQDPEPADETPETPAAEDDTEPPLPPEDDTAEPVDVPADGPEAPVAPAPVEVDETDPENDAPRV